jgi:hypothetical protein
VQKLGLELFAPERPGLFGDRGERRRGDGFRRDREGIPQRFGAIIANGQGSMKGQIFRIAHLGYFDFADCSRWSRSSRSFCKANGFRWNWHGRGGRPGIYSEAEITPKQAVHNMPNQILIAEPLAAGRHRTCSRRSPAGT